MNDIIMLFLIEIRKYYSRRIKFKNLYINYYLYLVINKDEFEFTKL